MTENQKNSINRNLNSINSILFQLKKSIKAKETVVFCGAGISKYSGLPLANDLIRYILEKLNISIEKTEAIINSNLPFEAFIETLRENSSVDRIFDIFDIGEPNTNHFLLAKLAKAKYIKTICTTNFDQLIEKALESEGLVRGNDYQVFYNEDDLDHIYWEDNKIHLIKIHGSVEDKYNIAITLQQVASEVLSEQRSRVIDYIFSKGTHKTVLILGYSCSDIFDISPKIEAIRERYKKVILLDHHENIQKVNDIAEKKEKNPFKHFLASKWVLFNTDDLMKTIWDFCLTEDDYISPTPSKNKTLWKKYVNDWYLETEEKYTKCAKYGIVVAILIKISKYESAVEYLDQALNIARKIGEKQKEGIFLGNLGSIYDSLGNYQKAIMYSELALCIAREIGDKNREGTWLGNLGSIYDGLGDYQKAIEFYEQASYIAKEIGYKKWEGRWLGNLGATFYSIGDYRKTKDYYEQALSIAREIGDKKEEGRWLGNLGIIYSVLGDYQKTITHYDQAIGIAREIGDKELEATWLGHLGSAYHNLSDFQKAIIYNKQALLISREIGDKRNEGSVLGNLGRSYEILGDYQKAIELHEQALSITREIGDKLGQESELGNLGNDYNSLGEYQKAIEFLEQALYLAREIGHKQGEGTWLGNLGNAYNILGEYHKAMECYNQALSITKEIGDKLREGCWLGNLGSVYNSLGDYKKAITHHEQSLRVKKEIGDKHGEGNSYGNLGNIYYKLGDYHEAIKYFMQALFILKPMLGNGHPDVKLFERNLSITKSQQKQKQFNIKTKQIKENIKLQEKKYKQKFARIIVEKSIAWKAHKEAVIDISFLPKANGLISGSFDSNLIWWDLKTNSIKKRKAFNDAIAEIAINPDGSTCGIAAYDGTAVIWFLPYGNTKELHKPEAPYYSVTFSPDGRWYAMGYHFGGVYLLNTKTYEPKILEKEGNYGAPIGLAFSRSSIYLASSYSENAIIIWNVKNGEVVRKLMIDRAGSIAIIESANQLIIGTFWLGDETQREYPDSVQVLDFETGELVIELENARKGMAVSTDCKLLSCCSLDGGIQLWDTTKWKRLASLKVPNETALCTAISHDNDKLACGTKEGSIAVFKISYS